MEQETFCPICGREHQGWIKEEAEKLEKVRGLCPTPLDICPHCGKQVPPPKSSFEYYCLIAYRREPDGDDSDSLNGYLTRYRERAKEYLEHGLPQRKKARSSWWDENRKDFREIKICATCYDLYGFFDYTGMDDEGQPYSRRLYQTSSCQHNELSYRKWDGFDFNEAITLCYCCGQEVLRSGSKFSCWFCSDCEDLIEGFPSMYKVVIPIGRHSFMHGIVLEGKDIDNKDAIGQFVNASKALFSRMDVLSDWKTHIRRKNFKILGLTDDILLFDYLSAIDSLPTKDNAVRGLVEFFIAWEKNTMIPGAGKV